MGKVCFMFGHHDMPREMYSKIYRAVEEEYLNGTTNFVIGSRGSFDLWAAVAVKDLKDKHKEITSTLLLAYPPTERKLYALEVMKYFDDSYYPFTEKVHYRYAIVRANQHMIKNCDSVVCYVNHRGNTTKLLEMAERLGVPLTNVAFSE